MKRIICLTSILLSVVSVGFSQSDDCSGAVSLTVGTSCVNTAFANNENNVEGTGLSTCATAGSDYSDVWYKFTAGSSSTTVTMSGPNVAGGLSIYSSCPTAPDTPLSCVPVAASNSGTIVQPTTAGSTYYIRIQRRGGVDKKDMSGKICVFKTPTPPSNDNCSAPILLTPSPAGSSTCTAINGTTNNATASAQPVCGGNPDDDVWYTFVANSTSHQVTVDGDANFNAYLEVFSGSCATTLTSIACINTTGLGGVETANLFGLTIGNTYYVRVYHNGAGSGSTASNAFTICVTSAVTPCNIGTGNLVAASLPYTSGAQTTCGAGDDITSSTVTNICGDDNYYTGEDKVITFTPTVSGNISANLTSTGSWVGISLYDGCPNAGGSCVAFSQSSTGDQSIGCAPVIAGKTYYLVVDSWASPTCNPFNVTITAPTGGIPLGTTCSNPYPVTLPFNKVGESTLCYGDDYNNSTSGSCGTLYESGEDKVYKLVTTGPDCIGISINNASTDEVGYQVYSGCPGAGGTCVANGGGATLGTLNGSFTVPGAGTYYIMIDTWASPSSVNYDLQLFSNGGTPNNDLPCNAIALGQPTASTPVSASGDNSCSGGTGEPAVPAGWTTGAVNTVWYTVKVPASGSFSVKASIGTLTDPQIAAYYGTCGSSLTLINSNNDVGSCGSNSDYSSQLTIGPNAAYPAGSLVYIRVDGANNLVGTFTIIAVDQNLPFPGIPGQDCSQPNPVCQSVMSVSNPGYSGNGNTCDIDNVSYCLGSGERNVVWYQIPISIGGKLSFNIVPNDFNSSIEDETDYDFAIWKTGASSGTLGTDYFDCSQIAAGTATTSACNYSYLGVTGVGNTSAGNAPSTLSAAVCPQCGGGYSPTTTYDDAYEPVITAATGDVYMLAVSNYSNSTSGFKIEFLTGVGYATINYAAATASNEVYWSGGDATVPTEMNDVDNWGGCNAPSCSIDAIISNVSNEPVVASGTTRSVKSITIQVGANLTLQPNSTLEICGDFINYGTITADPTSTVKFIGTGLQNVTGSFVGGNALGNVVVTKLTGSVLLNNDMDMTGSFTTSTATSILNSNQKTVKVAKDFTNSNGNATYTNTGTTGLLVFNGSGVQNYNQGTTQLDLNKVTINNTAVAGSGVKLLTNMFIKVTTGNLLLSLGTITTNANRVEVDNSSAASVNMGNINSFVDGNLRRYLSNGTFEWPVGNVSKGYQRATTVLSANTINYIDARFDIWPITPPTQGGSECATTYNLPAEDNGYWTLSKGNSGTATYDMTLYPLNATNTASANGWTIMKKDPPVIATGWLLNGTCVMTSTATVVKRNGMSNFSVFGVAQATKPLPIELLSFTGEEAGEDNLLSWTTESEHDNDYFTLERSRDAVNFEILATVDGAGNSNGELHYQQFDYHPFAGVSYYRLKQTDFNGEDSYSQVIALTRDIDTISVSDLFPNPTEGIVNFNVESPKETIINFTLYDNAGRLIYQSDLKVVAGVNTFSINTSSFAKGIYTAVINSSLLEKKKIKELIKL